jgi:WD40 repeat protein
LVEALRDGQVLVGAMTPEELRQAITGPAEAVGCRVETALVSRLVSDATGQPGALPLVSHALRETWRRRRGTVLSLGAYEAAGGIHHALARTADAVYSGLDDDRRLVAHRLFLRLTALGEGSDDTKRRVRRAELDESAATLEVLERLATARLVTVDRDGIEITHEALIRHWPRLRGWLDDDRDALRVHRRLTEATQLWQAHDRDRGSLLRGVRLTQVETLAATALTDREREFRTASLAARTEEQSAARRRIRRTRQLVALLAILLAVACVSLVLAVRAQSSATAQRNAAVIGSVLSDASLLRDTDPALSLQLTLAAYRADPSPRARDSLLNALDTPYASRIESGEFVDSAVLSPDGALVVVPGQQRTGLWDLADRYRPARLPDLPSAEKAAFGPDRTLLIKARLGTYEVWDLREPRRPRRLASFASDASQGSSEEYVHSAVAYSRDGRNAATVDNDGTARLWDLTAASPRPVALMPAVGRPGDTELAALASAAFSPRGDRLAVANSSHTVQLWDVTARPHRLAVLPGDIAGFTPDGRTLAVAGRHGSVQLWDVASTAPRRLATFANQGDVVSLAFNPRSPLMAVGDLNGEVSLWNVADPRRPVALTDLAGQLDGGWSVAFGPRGDMLVAADHGAVWIWDLGPVLVSHPDGVTTVRVNHRGNVLATGGRDHAVRLWQVDGRRLLATIPVPYTPDSLTFSPDDRTLVLSGAGPTQMWDIATPERPDRAATLPESRNGFSVAFDPTGTVAINQTDGRIAAYDLADAYHPKMTDDIGITDVQALALHPSGDLMAVSHDTYLQLWDLAAPVTSRYLTVRQTPVGALVAFAPDGRTMAVFRNDNRDILLLGIGDPRHPELLATLHPRADDDGAARDAGPLPVYSADSHLLAAPDGDRTVGLWDISDPRKPSRVTTYTAGHEIGALSMSADGRQLFMATEENVVQRRYLDVADVTKRICTMAYPRISPAQWRDHFQDLPYEPPCR